jgi:hypothetical protein
VPKGAPAFSLGWGVTCVLQLAVDVVERGSALFFHLLPSGTVSIPELSPLPRNCLFYFPAPVIFSGVSRPLFFHFPAFWIQPPSSTNVVRVWCVNSVVLSRPRLPSPICLAIYPIPSLPKFAKIWRRQEKINICADRSKTTVPSGPRRPKSSAPHWPRVTPSAQLLYSRASTVVCQ